MTNMQTYQHYYSNLEEMSEAVADKITLIAEKKISQRGLFSLVLTGGRTPGLLYRLIAEKNINWHKTHIFWGDERCVPPDHADSNFRLAQRNLLDKISIPPANIHRMKGELPDPEEAAQEYEQEIRFFLSHITNSPEKKLSGKLSGFDLVLLGMGEDGHIASIFPGSPIIKSTQITAAAYPEFASPRCARLTLTIKILNRSEKIFMLISGNKKKQIFNDIKTGKKKSSRKYPAALLQPQGVLSWEIAG